MKQVLQDYLEIYQRFPSDNTWNKAEKKERHKQIMEWQKRGYQDMPDIDEIDAFIKENPKLVFEKPFWVKLLVPCVYEDIENGTIKAIRYLFESNQSDDVGNMRDYVNIFCEASGWKYSPEQLINIVLEKEPDNQVVLQNKYVRDLNYLSFSVHEIPYGVLNGMNGAEKSSIPLMLEILEGFEEICAKLGRLDTEHKNFIDFCRRMYVAWAEYLDKIENYNGFCDYLEKNNIEFE